MLYHRFFILLKTLVFIFFFSDLKASEIVLNCKLTSGISGEQDETDVEFKNMVDDVRNAEKALGKIHYGGVKGEVRIFRKSLFVVKDMKKGDEFIENVNVKSIRPGDGIHSRYLTEIVGKKCSQDIEYGTPLSWKLIN